MIIQIKTFIKSLIFHIWSGLPKCTQKEINDRYNICLGCNSFDRDNASCMECGCNINNKRIFMNKLAWADQYCPLDKWPSIKK